MKLFDQFPLPVCRVRMDGSCVYVNQAWLSLTGQPLSRQLGDGWTRVIHPDDRDMFLKEYRSALKRSVPFAIQYRFRNSDGEYRSMVQHGAPLWNGAKLPHEYIVVCHDITEETRLRSILEDSRQLLASINEVVWLRSLDNGEVFYVSPAYERIWGRSCNSLYASPFSWRDAIHPEDRKRVNALADHRIQPIRDITYRIVRPNGAIRTVHVRTFPIADANGRINRIAGVAADVTKQHKTEQALRQSERRFRQLAENIEQVFWMWTRHPGQLLYVSPAYAKIWGRSLASLYRAPRSWRKALHPDDKKRVISQITEPSLKLQLDITYRIIRPDGAIRWIRDRTFPVRDEDDKIVCFAGVADDVTEDKQSEEALSNANRQLRILSRRRIQIQEDERRYIARELHDQIGQTLTAIKVGVEGAKKSKQRPTRTRHLNNAIRLLGDTLKIIRRISLDLRPPILDDLGLGPTLRSLLEDLAKQVGWTFEFYADSDFERPDSEIEIACFRITLEALTNIIRHAKARRVTMTLNATKDKFRIVICDDGIGFDLAEAEKRIQRNHLGLVGMRERAVAVGGNFQCISKVKQGTEVMITLPYRAI